MTKALPSKKSEPDGKNSALVPKDRKEGKLIPTVGFTTFEKNLASLGFFTASSKAVKNLKEKKVTLVRRESGNKVVEATATILPSSKYGLPVTSASCSLDKPSYDNVVRI